MEQLHAGIVHWIVYMTGVFVGVQNAVKKDSEFQ